MILLPETRLINDEEEMECKAEERGEDGDEVEEAAK